MVIFFPAALIFLYLFVRLILPLPMSGKAKAAAGVVLFLVSQEHLLNRIFFGSLSSPDLPVLVLLVQGWLFAALLILCVFVLVRDIVCLVRWFLGKVLFRRPKKIFSSDRRAFLVNGAAALPAVFGARQALLSGLILAPTAYGASQAVAPPEARAMDVLLPRLPAALDGLTLVQISDTHVNPLFRKDWVVRLVERVNALNPDIILITGDVVDGLPADRADSVAVFRKLRARHGVFTCVGNHEYYGDFHAWTALFPEFGLSVLMNGHSTLDIRGHELVIAGVTDIAAQRFALPEPDVAGALAGAPAGAVRILLDHRPGNAARNALAGVDLQLSGHTHGGHMPGMADIVARFNQGYVRGWYDVHGMPLYVNAGAGLWSGFPVRLGVPPEIACITLRAPA